MKKPETAKIKKVEIILKGRRYTAVVEHTDGTRAEHVGIRSVTEALGKVSRLVRCFQASDQPLKIPMPREARNDYL